MRYRQEINPLNRQQAAVPSHSIQQKVGGIKARIQNFSFGYIREVKTSDGESDHKHRRSLNYFMAFSGGLFRRLMVICYFQGKGMYVTISMQFGDLDPMSIDRCLVIYYTLIPGLTTCA